MNGICKLFLVEFREAESKYVVKHVCVIGDFEKKVCLMLLEVNAAIKRENPCTSVKLQGLLYMLP